jgi:hypothetical protein
VGLASGAQDERQRDIGTKNGRRMGGGRPKRRGRV